MTLGIVCCIRCGKVQETSRRFRRIIVRLNSCISPLIRDDFEYCEPSGCCNMSVAATLWMVDADAVADADLHRFRDWLSAGELARYQRFVRAQRLRQFVVGRVLLRKALGGLLNVAPPEIELEER